MFQEPNKWSVYDIKMKFSKKRIIEFEQKPTTDFQLKKQLLEVQWWRVYAFWGEMIKSVELYQRHLNKLGLSWAKLSLA